ncbi:MAG: hypothetical protein GYB67_19715 [Chloroflexi bacterium]|nr:hypothetical protein [Chloroflexota bacterium]
MSEEQQQLHRSAQFRRGVEMIRWPHLISDNHVVLHLWCLPEPSVVDPASWTVYVKGTRRYPFYDYHKTYFLQAVRWHRFDDLDQWRAAAESAADVPMQDPTLSLRQTQLDTNEFLAHIAAARSIAIPIIGVEPSVTASGTSYGLQMPDYFGYGGYRLIWGADGPHAWHNLTNWARRLRERFDALLAEASGTESP